MTSRVGWLASPARVLCAPLLRTLYRARVTGVEHVPVDGPAIIAANHQSFFDTPLLMLTAPRRVIFLGKAEYMDSWKTRHTFPAFGMVPIDREKSRASMAALATAADLLAQGELVGIYPEGTRSRDGLLHRGHSGVAHLSLMTGAPVVPVGITGTVEVQPIGRGVPRPYGRLSVEFGEPVRPERYQAGGKRKRRSHITADVMAAIARMTDQEQSSDFSSDEPPLVRGGSESVYRVHKLRGAAPTWGGASRLVVSAACERWDDARIGEVGGLRCRIADDGSVAFEIDMNISTRFQPAVS